MKYIIPLELVELEEGNYHLAVKSVFEDGTGLTWVIDTGASKTVFDRTLSSFYIPVPEEAGTKVRSAGIGTGQPETSLGRLRYFSLAEFPIPSLDVALIDLSHINDLYLHAAARTICGLIGSDLLVKYKAVIDYSRLKLTLTAPKHRGNTLRQ